MKGKSKADILGEPPSSRLGNDRGRGDCKTALAEVDRIAALRLEDILW